MRELQHTYDLDRSEDAYLASIAGKTAVASVRFCAAIPLSDAKPATQAAVAGPPRASRPLGPLQQFIRCRP